MLTRCESQKNEASQKFARCRPPRTAISQSSVFVAIEVWQDSEIACPGAASTRRHYQSHPGTHFPVQAMAGDPAPLIAEPRTCRRRDRLISSGLRPSERQDIIFAFSSHTQFARRLMRSGFWVSPWYGRGRNTESYGERSATGRGFGSSATSTGLEPSPAANRLKSTRR